MNSHQSIFMAVALSVFFLIWSCSPPQESDAQIREAIAEGDRNFMSAFNAGDAAALAMLYTNDGQLLPPNSGMVSGTEAIRQFWQGAMDMGIKTAKLEIAEVKGLGRLAYEAGTYQLFLEGDQLADRGKYLVIWKKEEGAWKLYRDIWNSSQPPAGPGQ